MPSNGLVEHPAKSDPIDSSGLNTEPHDAAREAIDSGKLGKVTLVLSSWYQNYAGFAPSQEKVEADKLDWKLWLGPAPDQPLSAFRYLRWRFFWDFGAGHLTDLHSHYGDVIHWYLNSFRPVDAQPAGANYVIDYFHTIQGSDRFGHSPFCHFILPGSRIIMSVFITVQLLTWVAP